MVKRENLESSTGHSRESSSTSSEDSEIDVDNVLIRGDPFFDRFSETTEEPEQDGDADEDEDQWTETDEEESEDHIPGQVNGEDEALDENLDLAVDKRSARIEDEIDISTLSTPQVSKPSPSPTPKPHHETIALGQHHLWMI